MFYACRREDLSMVDKLVECGCNVSQEILKYVVSQSSEEAFRYLSNMVDAPSADDLAEMLRETVSYGQGYCVSALLEMGADPDMPANDWDEEGESLLLSAAGNDCVPNNVLRHLIISLIQNKAIKKDELSDIYSSLINRNMLEELKMLYASECGKSLLQDAVEDYKILGIIKDEKMDLLRFLINERVPLNSDCLLQEAIEVCSMEGLSLALEVRGNDKVPLKYLNAAIEKNFSDGVALLLTHHPDSINISDAAANPLCKAIIQRNAKCIDLLLDFGAEINLRSADTRENNIPIVAAAVVSVNDSERLESLIGAGLEIRDDDEMLLVVAAMSNSAECLDILLPRIKASVANPLSIAAGRGFSDCVSRFLASGVDVKELIRGKNPILLHSFVSGKTPQNTKTDESIGMLLKAGADPNVKGEEYDSNYNTIYTSLGAAIAYNYPHSCIEELVKAGADVNVIAAHRGYTPLMLAAEQGAARVVDLLCNAGSDVDAINSYGATALMFAAESGFPEIVNRLIVAGADAQAKDYAGKDAFMYALSNANLRSAELLLALGCVPAALSTIQTPFFPMVDDVLGMLRRNNVPEEVVARLLGSLIPAVVVESKPNVEIITKLVEYGADGNATDEKGNTGLLTALSKGCSGPIIKAILAAGADPRVTDRKGQTAVQIAENARCSAGVITMLKKAIEKIEKAEAKAAEKAAKAKEKAAKSAKKKK